MATRPDHVADIDSALDLSRHIAKRRLLATVRACNVARLKPSKAHVVRLAMQGRRASGMTRSRWYVLLDELTDCGYLDREQTVTGYRLTCTKAGQRALRVSE